MAKPPVPTDKVTISAELKERGLSLFAQSRALSAFDRLLGGALDVPAAWLEGKANDIRQAAENRAKLSKTRAKSAAKQIEKNSISSDANSMQLMSVASANTIRKQHNIEMVALEAYNQLQDQRDADSEDINDQNERQSLDDDWLNMFQRFAEDASSERLRRLWGRILAGEIRKPKNFSLTTLRFISELDQDIAILFESIASKRGEDGIIVKPSNLHGVVLKDFLFLEELGLLSGVDGNIIRKWNITDSGSARLQIGSYVLVIEGQPNSVVKVEVINLTRTGREVAAILPPPDEHGFALAFAESAMKDANFCALIGPNESVQAGATGYGASIEVLKGDNPKTPLF